MKIIPDPVDVGVFDSLDESSILIFRVPLKADCSWAVAVKFTDIAVLYMSHNCLLFLLFCFDLFQFTRYSNYSFLFLVSLIFAKYIYLSDLILLNSNTDDAFMSNHIF